MLVATTDGSYAITKTADCAPGVLVVKAKLYIELMRLLETIDLHGDWDAKVQELTDDDFLFQIHLRREDVLDYIADVVLDLDC